MAASGIGFIIFILFFLAGGISFFVGSISGLLLPIFFMAFFLGIAAPVAVFSEF